MAYGFTLTIPPKASSLAAYSTTVSFVSEFIITYL